MDPPLDVAGNLQAKEATVAVEGVGYMRRDFKVGRPWVMGAGHGTSTSCMVILGNRERVAIIVTIMIE